MRTRIQTHKEDVPEDSVRGGVPNQTDRAWRPCPDASDFRLGNVKQTQKQEPGDARAGLGDRGSKQILGLYFTRCHGYQNRVDTCRKRKTENWEDSES